jgi:hypothetical protein
MVNELVKCYIWSVDLYGDGTSKYYIWNLALYGEGTSKMLDMECSFMW